jgi:hypothetical protein
MFSPSALVDLRPIVEVFQRLRPQAVELALALASASHQARLSQDLQMLGDRRKGEVEALDKVLHRALACREEMEDPPSIGIDDRMEDLLARLEHGVTIV